MNVKALLRLLARRVFRDYRINWIVAGSDPLVLPLASRDEFRKLDDKIVQQLSRSGTPRVANSITFTRAGLDGFAIVRDGVPVCVIHVARPAQYHQNRIWPIHANEVAIMDVVTEEAARGQGLAPRIIAATSRLHLGNGVGRVIAFVWWSNTSSIRAFAKVGMHRVGLSVEVCFVRWWWRCRFKIPRRAGRPGVSERELRY